MGACSFVSCFDARVGRGCVGNTALVLECGTAACFPFWIGVPGAGSFLVWTRLFSDDIVCWGVARLEAGLESSSRTDPERLFLFPTLDPIVPSSLSSCSACSGTPMKPPGGACQRGLRTGTEHQATESE